jgi:protoporphyrinogen oxidase
MRPWVDTTQRKRKKKKANNQQKNKKKKPYANMTQGYKMMIKNNEEDLRRESYHLPQIC